MRLRALRRMGSIECSHSNYIRTQAMSTINALHPLKIIPIGNSRGVRLPQALLRRYGMADKITLEERPEGLLLRGSASGKVSLKETFTEMAREHASGGDDWSDLDALASDGLDKLKW